jgi:hypothetical protein
MDRGQSSLPRREAQIKTYRKLKFRIATAIPTTRPKLIEKEKQAEFSSIFSGAVRANT